MGDALELAVELNTTPRDADERAALLTEPGFGRVFTDHMATAEWSTDTGWHSATIRPYGPLTFDPATSFLHYGQAVFEGFKAYRHADGSIHTFRPELNAARQRIYESIKEKDTLEAFAKGKVAKITTEAISILHAAERKAWGLDKPDDAPPVIVVERG